MEDFIRELIKCSSDWPTLTRTIIGVGKRTYIDKNVPVEQGTTITIPKSQYRKVRRLYRGKVRR